MKNLLQTRQQIATFIALLFHISGFIAIALFHSELFVRLTPLNLLVSCLLLIWTQEEKNKAFWTFAVTAFIIGFAAEYIGIHTRLLFGDYRYGGVLGPKWRDVPWMIGVTWFGITYCAGSAMSMLQQRIFANAAVEEEDISRKNQGWMIASLIADAALLAVIYDWILEPVAVKLGFWTWENGIIPASNYLGWFGVSALVLVVFQQMHFKKYNLFAVHLLLIQVLFFLLLRTFY